jgi:hypothetical protein
LRLLVAAFTVKVWAFDVPPPGEGLVTVMGNPPAVVRSLAGTVAVNCVLLTQVVVRAAPAQFTTEACVKFVPFTVKVNCAPPTFPLVGEMLVVVGAGWVKVTCQVEVEL